MTQPAEEEPQDDSRWFRRYRFANDEVDEVRAEVEQLRAALPAAATPAEELATRLSLGSGLFPLGYEDEAVAVLEPAVALAEQLGDRARLIEVRLNFGTALQYAGRRDEARRQLDAALGEVRASGITDDEHYLLHHRGRLRAEAGDVEAARSDFEAALALRLATGEPWQITSTRTALDELDAWCAARPRGGTGPSGARA